MAKKKYIETPEKMWELFEAYKKDVKDNPRFKIEYVGRNGDKVKTPIERPLTIEGFKTFCAYKVGTIQHYWNNSEDAYGEYRTIVQRVREEIRAEQVDGGLTNQYNSNLTARVTGYADNIKSDATHNIKVLNIDPLDGSTDNSTS